MTDEHATRFSIAGFAVALFTVAVGTAAGLELVPVVGSYVGMLLGGLVAGLAIEDRPLLESGLAAVLAGLGLLAAGPLVGNGISTALSALGSIAPTTLLVSIILSFSVGAFGAHFGDDLRDGLTAPVEDTAPSPTVFGAVGSLLPATESSETERAEEKRTGDEPADRRSEEPVIERRSEKHEIDRRSETTESADVELEREE